VCEATAIDFRSGRQLHHHCGYAGKRLALSNLADRALAAWCGVRLVRRVGRFRLIRSSVVAAWLTISCFDINRYGP
jgi:hypothetical protein